MTAGGLVLRKELPEYGTIMPFKACVIFGVGECVLGVVRVCLLKAIGLKCHGFSPSQFLHDLLIVGNPLSIEPKKTEVHFRAGSLGGGFLGF